MRNGNKTVAGTLNAKWCEYLKDVLPEGMSISMFVTIAVKNAITGMQEEGIYTLDAFELEKLQIENEYLKRLIKDLANKTGV
jgi:hypothetical protein